MSRYKPALDLTASDFESLRGRAANRRTRQRIRLRERMSDWGRRVSPRLSTLGIESEVVLTEEEGANALRFVLKNDEGVLVLRVDEAAVEVALELPRVRVDGPSQESRLLASLESLPEQFVIRSEGEEMVAQASSLDELERAPSWIGWVVPREVAIEHAELLDDQLEDALAALAGVLAVAAPAATQATAHKEKGKRARLSTSASRRAAPPALGKGAQVQVLHGPFAGKTGVIVSLDGKGGARVSLGLLEARMALADLALAASAGRPRLGTSHRRMFAR